MATVAAQNTPTEIRALNPFVTYDPAVMQKSNTRWKSVWLVAALVTAVAFIALATAAIIYTTVHFPIHLPTVSILVFAAGMPTSYRAFEYLWHKKDHYAQEAAIDAQLIQHMKANTQGDSKLKSVQARYSYYQARKEHQQKKTTNFLSKEKPQSIAEVDCQDLKAVRKFKKRLNNQEKAQMNTCKAALSNLQSAYFLHLMENPCEKRMMAAFFKYVPFGPEIRSIAKEYGDKTADILLKTSTRNYTPADLLRKTPEQLKREIFSGKSSWFG